MPFSQVKSICSGCDAQTFDEVTLRSGGKLRCNVIGQNPEYFVVERFGEMRALKKSNVSSLSWKDDAPRELPSADQLIFSSGLALQGTIVSAQRGRYFVIQVGEHVHVVWHWVLKAAFKGGGRAAIAQLVSPALWPSCVVDASLRSARARRARAKRSGASRRASPRRHPHRPMRLGYRSSLARPILRCADVQ